MAISAVPKDDITRVEGLIRRRNDNTLIKSSDIGMNDKLCSEFLTELFDNTDICAAVVTAKCNDHHNAELFSRIKNGIDPSLNKKYGSKPRELIRISAFLSGFLKLRELPGTDQIGLQFEIIFDQETESDRFKEEFNDLSVEFTKNYSGFSFNRVRFVFRDEEPLLMISDWIAGATLRDIRRDDLPKTREILNKLERKKRVIVREGFSANVPKK